MCVVAQFDNTCEFVTEAWPESRTLVGNGGKNRSLRETRMR